MSAMSQHREPVSADETTVTLSGSCTTLMSRFVLAAGVLVGCLV